MRSGLDPPAAAVHLAAATDTGGGGGSSGDTCGRSSVQHLLRGNCTADVKVTKVISTVAPVSVVTFFLVMLLVISISASMSEQ